MFKPNQKAKVKKTVLETVSGTLHNWLVKGDRSEYTFRINVFVRKPSLDQSETTHYELWADVCCLTPMEWVSIIKTTDFSDSEVKRMVDGKTVLHEVGEFIGGFYELEFPELSDENY